MTKKTCSVCKQEKDITEFYMRPDRQKPIARCKECNYETNKKTWSKKTPEEKIKSYQQSALSYNKAYLSGNVKRIIQHKMAGWRGNAKKKNVQFDLDVDYLLELYNKQEGKCYYTGVILEQEVGRGRGKRSLTSIPNQLSLDRIVPSLGYTKGNVAWCSYKINVMKNCCTGEEFYILCNKVIEYRQACQDQTFADPDEE